MNAPFNRFKKKSLIILARLLTFSTENLKNIKYKKLLQARIIAISYKMTDLKVKFLSDDEINYDLIFKLIVIGDSGVGKSCLALKATKNIYKEKNESTIGFEFISLNLKINGTVARLQIWDTCGQEIYRSLISNF